MNKNLTVYQGIKKIKTYGTIQGIAGLIFLFAILIFLFLIVLLMMLKTPLIHQKKN